MSNEIYTHDKRPIKETYKRDLQKRPTKETYKRDLLHFKSDLYASKEAYNRDLQNSPTKETNKREIHNRPITSKK